MLGLRAPSCRRGICFPPGGGSGTRLRRAHLPVWEMAQTVGHDRGDKRRRVSSTLWMLASLTAAGWIVWSSRDDIALLADASPWLIASMTALHVVTIMTQSERFRLVLEQHAVTNIGIGSWTRVYVRGRLYSTLVPQSGNVYRGLALKQDHDTPVVRYVSSLATQTWLAVLAGLLFAALIVLLTLLGEHEETTTRVVQGLLFAAFVVGVAPLVFTRLSGYLPGRVRRTRIARLAGEALDIAGSTARSPKVLAIFLALVLVGLVTSGIGMTVAFAVAGEEIAMTTGIAVIALVNLGNIASITPGNLGIQELGLAALAVLFEYPPASGVLASVVVRLSNIVALAAILVTFEIVGLVTRRSLIH